MEFLHLWSIDLSSAPQAQRRRAANDALRRILSGYLPEGAGIELVEGENGKPRLAGGGAEFNLSHSGGIALAAVSGGHPVGVDVELVDPDRDVLALAERALGPEGVAAVRAAAPADRPLAFHRLWVRHEARLKCVGAGIFRESPPPAEGVAVEDIAVAPGYAAAVALAAPRLPPLRFWTFDPGALQKDGGGVS